MCCICYATIGIPIFLLCVANISGVLGEMFRFIYAKVICRPCLMIKKRRDLARQQKLQEEQENSVGVEPRQSNGWTAETAEPQRTSIKKPSNQSLTNPNETNEIEQMDNQRVAVPLTVTMIIIAGYIWIGSALFHNFEGWSMIQAGYFCFITLGKSINRCSLSSLIRLFFLFQQQSDLEIS